jgi:hypothetical protein
LAAGGAVRVVHAKGAAVGVMAGVRDFLRALGCGVVVEEDRDEAMLVRDVG